MEAQQSDFKIVVFDRTHAQKIAGFQLKMAKQTQNLNLIYDLVIKALEYLSDHHQLGFYLVKMHGSTPIGSLLLTFENSESWWVQSVYVEKQYRRQGRFKSLFNQACRLAKQRGIHSIKLYAQGENEKAKQAYRSLGMQMNGEKFYEYDFVYGKTKLSDFKEKASGNNITIKLSQKSQIQSHTDFIDILSKQSISKNRSIQIYKGEKLIGVAFYFIEFSQWRFGLSYYVDSLYVLNQLGSEEINEIHNSLCEYFSSQTQINLGALRYIFREKSSAFHQILKGGEIGHHDVMVMDF